MHRISLLGTTAAVIVLLVGLFVLHSGGGPSTATAAGPPQLSLGAISASGGNVRIAINISGTAIDPYGGVTSVLLWDPAVFTFSSFDNTGTVIPSPFCANGAASSSTGPHNGVTDGYSVGCATLAGSTTNTGLVGTFVLAPVSPGVGCSPLHLLTLNPPDNDPNGSVTLDPLSNNQATTYGTIDVAGVNTTGGACALPTATPTNTGTPTVTNTATVTSTPTATGTPTVTNTPPPGATNTPTPNPNLDTDGDGYPDVLELSLGQDPNHYCGIMRADVNMDHKVDLADLIIVSGWYKQSIPPAPPRFDQNADGRIDLSDLIIMSAYYGQNIFQCPPPPPTPTPTFTNTPTVTPTFTNTPTVTNTPTPTDTPTPTNTPTDTPTATNTPTNTPTPTPTDTPTPTFTPTVTNTPTNTPTPTDTPTATFTPTPTPTDTPTPTPTSTPTITPTATIDPTLDTDGDGYPDVLELSLGKDPTKYCVVMRADVNMDHKVTLADLIIAAGWYNKTIPPAPPRVDQNADGKITLADLIIMSGVYGQSISVCP